MAKTTESPPDWPSNWRWRHEPLEPGPAVVFDIDGVLSNAIGRQHLLQAQPADWDAFFDACGEDPLIDEMAVLLKKLDPGLQIILLTGRPLRVQPQTLQWLEGHGLRWDLLIMRKPPGWTRKYKEASLQELKGKGFDLQLAFEDALENAEMIRSLGIACVYIHSGYYG